VRLFLDTSVLLAAAGSVRGASFAVFEYASCQNWTLVSSPYVLAEVTHNLPKLHAECATKWLTMREQLTIVDDVLALGRPVVFSAAKDRPILFTALAFADILLTLDRADFAEVLGARVLWITGASALRVSEVGTGGRPLADDERLNLRSRGAQGLLPPTSRRLANCRPPRAWGKMDRR
jgi:hypothetical protein